MGCSDSKQASGPSSSTKNDTAGRSRPTTGGKTSTGPTTAQKAEMGAERRAGKGGAGTGTGVGSATTAVGPGYGGVGTTSSGMAPQTPDRPGTLGAGPAGVGTTGMGSNGVGSSGTGMGATGVGATGIGDEGGMGGTGTGMGTGSGMQGAGMGGTTGMGGNTGMGGPSTGTDIGSGAGAVGPGVHAGGVAPLSGRGLSDVAQVPPSLGANSGGAPVTSAGMGGPGYGAGTPSGGVGSTVGQNMGGGGGGSFGGAGMSNNSPMGTPTSGYQAGGTGNDSEKQRLLSDFETKGLSHEGRIEVINDLAVAVFSNSGHSEDETYLVSFMRATDNYNEGEAHHKFNQMRRLLTSSGDNWKQVLRTYLLP